MCGNCGESVNYDYESLQWVSGDTILVQAECSVCNAKCNVYFEPTTSNVTEWPKEEEEDE